MSVFDNNITSELPQVEQIRYWFTQKIQEWFDSYQYPGDMFDTEANIANKVHEEFIFLWTDDYKNVLRKMGVVSTITRVRKSLKKNRFRVIVSFAISPDVTPGEYFYDKYEHVDVSNLKLKYKYNK